MAFSYTYVFVALLVAYMAYSVWARLDARYPVVGALLLLLVAGGFEAAREFHTAELLASYVVLLLGGGLILLWIEHVRSGPTPEPPSGSSARAVGEAAETPKER